MLSYENTIMLGEERVLVIQERDGRCWCLTAMLVLPYAGQVTFDRVTTRGISKRSGYAFGSGTISNFRSRSLTGVPSLRL
jgi:hypothetical protein